MSTYYYFHARGTNEFFELTSHSWYPYMEDLFEVLLRSQKQKEPFSAFLDRLKNGKVFEGFYDEADADFLTPNNIKYFLRPLYDWTSLRDSDNLIIVDDYMLYDIAVRKFCEEKGLTYKKEKWDNYSDEIERELKKLSENKDSWDGLVDHCLKMVGLNSPRPYIAVM